MNESCPRCGYSAGAAISPRDREILDGVFHNVLYNQEFPEVDLEEETREVIICEGRNRYTSVLLLPKNDESKRDFIVYNSQSFAPFYMPVLEKARRLNIDSFNLKIETKSLEIEHGVKIFVDRAVFLEDMYKAYGLELEIPVDHSIIVKKKVDAVDTVSGEYGGILAAISAVRAAANKVEVKDDLPE